MRATFLLGLLLCVPGGWAKERPPVGMLAVSAGEVVVLADPTTGLSESIPAGPVAWLFPAPGGILFAPDLVNGRTTVVNLRTAGVEEVLDGVTMPHFGTMTDRYVVVGGNVLVMSYPERALIDRFDLEIDHPWQVAVLAGNSVLMVLERRPDGRGGTALAALNLGGGELVYRRPLSGDVRHMAFSPPLGVMALAEASSNRVFLVDPGTLAPAAVYEVPGVPVDLVFADGGTTLVVALARDDGRGELVMWRIKAGKEGLERKKEWIVELGGEPVRMAVSPDLRHVAVGLSSASLQVVEVANQQPGATVKLPAAPRDVVWCDPAAEGPLVPEWSDEEAPQLDLGGVR